LLSSFLRLVDLSDGAILIDGVNIGQVPRNIVRERLICLPQDAFILSGTFRFNIDPTNRVSNDAILIDILERVGLWPLVEKRGGLTVIPETNSLSHGEQQLLALARAIVRKHLAGGKCILILDEATSNLDSTTEAIIQEVIKKDFKENTVITVAHRLDTVREADFIVMLDKGEVTKIGTPQTVL
jgi:ATP-binding cassette subfamily C (CFTR/MRP) protein 1